MISAEELFIDHRVMLRKAVMNPDDEFYLSRDEKNGIILFIEQNIQ